MRAIAAICLGLTTGVSAIAAPQEIAWGEAAKGLRVGIAMEETTDDPAHQPRFKVVLENMSEKAITIPAFNAYMEKSREDCPDFRAQPVSWKIESITGQPAICGYGVGVGDPEVKAVSRETVALAPAQALIFEQVPLKEGFFCESRQNGKTESKVWWLVPGSEYRVSLSFANQQSTANHKKIWSAAASSSPLTIRVPPFALESVAVDGVFTLPKQDYFLGEPIYATFTAYNRSHTVISFQDGGDYRGTGRHERYKFTTVSRDGTHVEDPVKPGGMGGGLGGDISVAPGGSFSRTMLVNPYCAFSQPGEYTCTASRVLNLRRFADVDLSFGDRYPPEQVLPQIRVETKLPLHIYRDDDALKAHVGSLQELLKHDYSMEAVEQLRALALAKNPIAFSAIESLMRDGGKCEIEAVEWLYLYGREKAGPVLFAAARAANPRVRALALNKLVELKCDRLGPLLRDAIRSKDKEERACAVLLCSRMPTAECLPVLLTMAGDEDALVRRYLGAALGETRDPKVIEPLRRLLADRDDWVRIWAADGLSKLSRYDGVPVLIEVAHKNADARANAFAELEDITGHHAQKSHALWQQWWNSEGKSKFLPRR